LPSSSGWQLSLPFCVALVLMEQPAPVIAFFPFIFLPCTPCTAADQPQNRPHQQHANAPLSPLQRARLDGHGLPPQPGPQARRSATTHSLLPSPFSPDLHSAHLSSFPCHSKDAPGQLQPRSCLRTSLSLTHPTPARPPTRVCALALIPAFFYGLPPRAPVPSACPGIPPYASSVLIELWSADATHREPYLKLFYNKACIPLVLPSLPSHPHSRPFCDMSCLTPLQLPFIIAGCLHS